MSYHGPMREEEQREGVASRESAEGGGERVEGEVNGCWDMLMGGRRAA